MLIFKKQSRTNYLQNKHNKKVNKTLHLKSDDVYMKRHPRKRMTAERIFFDGRL